MILLQIELNWRKNFEYWPYMDITTESKFSAIKSIYDDNHSSVIFSKMNTIEVIQLLQCMFIN